MKSAIREKIPSGLSDLIINCYCYSAHAQQSGTALWRLPVTSKASRRHVLMSLAQIFLAPYLQLMQAATAQYKPRRPEETVLYKVVENNFEAFLNSVTKVDKHIPKYVIEEFEAYLACGRLENGFARLKCNECDYERLLPFSCKRRGFCPSCCGRRMNEAEIRIAEEIFPRENARQWVLSLPIPLRFFCARNRSLLNELARVFSTVVERLLRRKLRASGITKARSGGVLFIQRIGGALNLNVHFHAIFIDGGYTLDKETQTAADRGGRDGFGSTEDACRAPARGRATPGNRGGSGRVSLAPTRASHGTRPR